MFSLVYNLVPIVIISMKICEAYIVVRTSYGNVDGMANHGIQIFTQIPYAEKPLGALRFKVSAYR